MARCPDCIHFSLCDYNTNIAGDAKIKLYYDEGAEKCSFFTPTADVVEVKHGEWKGESLTCSVCGRDISEIYDADSYMSYGIEDELKWCPFCGAKMDGRKAKKNGIKEQNH